VAKPEYADEIFDYDEGEKRPASFFDIVFVFLVLLASIFSAVTTYIGFNYDLPWMMAGALATIIGLGIFAVNLKLRENRIFGRSIFGTLFVFLILFIFSFISNTNAIYTFFIQNDIVKDTQLEAWSNFDKGTIGILKLLDESSITAEGLKLKQQLDPAVGSFIRQLCDPNNPGLGVKAVRHLGEIEAILGVPLTRLREPADRGVESYKLYCERYREYIYSIFSDKYTTTQTEEMDDLTNAIHRDRTFYESAINKKDWDSEYADGMQRGLNTFKERAQALLKIDLEIPHINIRADEIGSFPFTWRNFIDGINLSAILLSILLSILLDILAPVISIAMYREEEEFDS